MEICRYSEIMCMQLTIWLKYKRNTFFVIKYHQSNNENCCFRSKSHQWTTMTDDALAVCALNIHMLSGWYCRMFIVHSLSLFSFSFITHQWYHHVRDALAPQPQSDCLHRVTQSQCIALKNKKNHKIIYISTISDIFERKYRIYIGDIYQANPGEATADKRNFIIMTNRSKIILTNPTTSPKLWGTLKLLCLKSQWEKNKT